MQPAPTGNALPLEPDTVPELLEQLVAQPLICLYCADPISRFELIVCWPVAAILAHFACYAQSMGFSKSPHVAAREGSS